MRVALAQSPRFRDPQAAASWLLERAPRADLLVLPEYWLGPRPLEGLQSVVSSMAELARSLGAVVVAGALAVKRGGEVKNVCPVVGPGGLVALGEKVFPSAATGERSLVSGGRRLALFEAAGWRVGCLACVDLAYPELARRLALAGAELIVNPASISADRRELWRALGLARAFENSIYVAAALGTGYSYADGRPAEGGSFVASPNGALVDFGGEPGVYSADLDKGEIAYARARRRYLEDARRMPDVEVG